MKNDRKKLENAMEVLQKLNLQTEEEEGKIVI